MPESQDFHIAGVGASAGGLEAIESLFEDMPADTGIAFVVIQHLSPDFKSHMEELLSRKTSLPVHLVTDSMRVQPNNIYLIPANHEMVIASGRLLLTERAKERTLTHPIDQFFRSLAHETGRDAIAIVLSGTGSDGSAGIRDVYGAGGLVLAQDGTSSKFDGMPLNAQSTGAVHLVLEPPAMVEALVRYTRNNLSPGALAEEELANTDGIERVFTLLRNANNVDFSYYKGATIGRRIERRMSMMHLDSVDEYCEVLANDSEELDRLYLDLLIGVTRFFRDLEAFEIMEREIVPELVANAAKTGRLRIWVAGCASGEEAYSLAMLFDEQIRREGASIELKIFATDIHRGSLKHAGQGIYSEAALEEVSPERRERYFQKKRDGYHVLKELRNHIVFAPHNVFHDAPFTQIDLLTCRNLLIYLQPLAQKKALSLFHFALKTGGYMFLGPSETTGDIQSEFEETSARWRISRKRRDVRLPLESRMPFSTTSNQMPRAALATSQKTTTKVDDELLSTYDQLLEKNMPPSILVDEDLSLLHSFAGAQHYLQVPQGRHSSSLMDLIDEGLKPSLGNALQQALSRMEEVTYTGIQTSSQIGSENVRLTVQPLHNPRTKVTRLLLKILPTAIPKSVSDDAKIVDMDEMSKERVTSLEGELRFTRENLQATIEELETSNEELQATNEEMLASNEELQSTNEELQSVNEELFTVNSEHQTKIEEVTLANADMDNLLALTRVGVVYLDNELCVRRYTPAIARLLNLLPHDIGRSIEGFVHKLDDGEILADIERSLQEDAEVEREVQDLGGNPYLLRIAPYRSGRETDGVVLTLVEIAGLAQARDACTQVSAYV